MKSSQDAQQLERPSTFARIAALAVGLLMILWLAWCGSVVTETPLALCLPIVGMAASAIMVVLTVFGVKAFEGKESWKRFNLSSLMLFSVPLGIYLAGFRVLLSRAPVEEFTVLMWVLMAVFAVLAMAVVTMLLTAMAEAILWAAALPLVRSVGPARSRKIEYDKRLNSDKKTDAGG